ncbi:DUF4157 domain-containing protein [Sphingomonas sp. DG1-23]|uniref:eCIS core domain-containing protein n=1 Tax=Sphingomonas sp. DG1-23 TaxID=3068316 RepID=UPI00273EA6C0|nr:DUF4157 domain-containing protein [Sphingomonas sp. DG1-23]MDP5279832.1 DUF4157 domain-containing protein [Sphingomonas sp. DG1-23]
MRSRFADHRAEAPVPPMVHEPALDAPGRALDGTMRSFMEGRFARDFSQVRVHTGSAAGASARAKDAVAYTHGSDIVFAPGSYAPHTARGRDLIAHELAHVAQQTRRGGGSGGAAHEAEADLAASAVLAGRAAPSLGAVAPGVQRRIQFRDVGKGEQSGFGRLNEIIDKLNNISTALIFSVDAAGILSYVENPYGTETEFDRKMKGFVDSATLIPLRLTNRHGLLRSQPAGPFNSRVDADAYESGYVDVDDMLGSDDLGFQIVLVHFLTERATTKDYAKRIGSTLDDTSQEFRNAHARGVQGEVDVLRDFFGDPGIRLLQDGGVGTVFRSYRSTRGDTIRARTPPSPKGVFGLDINLVDVRLRDGTTMSANDYKALLERERAEAAAANEAAGRRRLLELKGSPQVGPAP